MRIFKILFLFIAIVFFTQCEKDKPNNTDDKAKYDNSILGNYSGVLVGSTGHINIELKETGGTATIVFDGITTQLSSSVAIQPGAKITGYTMQKDAIKIVLDINADGTVPQVAVTIPGHDVTAVVFKVTSTVMVENYIGTFANSDSQSPQYNNSGTFNFSIKGNDVLMLSKCQQGDCGGSAFEKITGKLVRNSNGFTINIDNCNPNENICTLAFTKTASGSYKYIESFGAGVQSVIEVRKVP